MPTEDIPIEAKPKFKIPKKLKLSLAITVSLLAILVISLIVFTQLNPQTPADLAIPTPTPTEMPVTEEIASPSAYATDSAILETEAILKDLDKRIQDTDLKETSLRPPVLDLEINFKQ